MSAPTVTTVATACAFCSMHNHGHCAGSGCACAARDHNPAVELAASMRRYERPDLSKLPVETLASQWHRKDEAR